MYPRIGASTRLGFKPLKRSEFDAQCESERACPRTPVQYCLAAITGELIAGRSTPDCDQNIVIIPFFADEIAEVALDIMRKRGGWRLAQIKGHTVSGDVVIAVC